MRTLLSLFFVISSITFADTNSFISSDHAFYDENILFLSGKVCLSHDFFLMKSSSAKLFDYNKDCVPCFSMAELQDEVFLTFKNNAHLNCEKASIHLTKLHGTISSRKSPAIYTDLLGQQKTPLEIQGKQGYFEMITSDDLKCLYPCDLKFLRITDDVFIKYGSDIKLFANKAHFQKFSDDATRYIKAFGSKEKKAKFEHYNDYVFADEIFFDLCKGDICMQNIHGSLYSSYIPHTEKACCDVDADHLYWNGENHLITLEGNVSILDQILGTLHAKHIVEIQEIKQYNHYVIKSISCKGPSKITCFDKQLQEEQSITSQEHLLFDRETLSLIATSPKNASIDEQIFYKNKALGVFADFASVEYKLKDLKFIPQTIHFKGSVKMQAEDLTLPLRFGFADEIQLDPILHQTLLLAKKGSKVLFWNEEENLRISADKILISYDPDLKTEKIKGIGNVRFTFNNEEEDNFRELFPKYIRSS